MRLTGDSANDEILLGISIIKWSSGNSNWTARPTNRNEIGSKPVDNGMGSWHMVMSTFEPYPINTEIAEERAHLSVRVIRSIILK